MAKNNKSDDGPIYLPIPAPAEFQEEFDLTPDNCAPGTWDYLNGEITADEAKEKDDTADW